MTLRVERTSDPKDPVVCGGWVRQKSLEPEYSEEEEEETKDPTEDAKHPRPEDPEQPLEQPEDAEPEGGKDAEEEDDTDDDHNNDQSVVMGEGTTAAEATTMRLQDKNDKDKNDDSLPRAFFCPLSHKVFSDPVVADDGITYERSFLVSSSSSSSLYPNRALRNIIEEKRLSEGNPICAGFKRLQHSAEAAVSQLLDASGLLDPVDASLRSAGVLPLSDGYYCPITFNLFHEPVIDPEGNTYERVAVENWIRVNGSSPVTRTPLTVNRLYPNLVLRRLLDEEGNKPEDQIHPDVRRWKGETPPKATDLEVGGGLPTPQSIPEQVPNNTTFAIPTVVQIERYQRRQRRIALERVLTQFMALVAGSICLVGLVIAGKGYFLILFMLVVVMALSERQIVD